MPASAPKTAMRLGRIASVYRYAVAWSARHRRLVLGGYVAAFLTAAALRGVPLDREQVLAWITGGLVLVTISSRHGRARSVLRDWLPFGLVLVAYDYSRGAADTLGMPVQWALPIDADRLLFAGSLPTVELQRALHVGRTTRWWEAAVSVLYVSHYIVPFAAAAWLWTRDRAQWVRYVRRFMLLTAAGLATYVALPTAPPWLASYVGLIPPIRRTAARGWSIIGLDLAERLLDKGQQSVNLVAALPSLHAAYAFLVAVFLWRVWRSRMVRGALLTYALAMAFVLVLSGEHYVFDVLLGWFYVLVAFFVASRWERYRAVRSTAFECNYGQDGSKRRASAAAGDSGIAVKTG